MKNNMIGEDMDGAVSGISGGERRRVSVGIGLVTDARAIFLDEPTTGLDSDSAEQLIALLSHLAAHKHRTVRPSPINRALGCRVNIHSLASTRDRSALRRCGKSSRPAVHPAGRKQGLSCLACMAHGRCA